VRIIAGTAGGRTIKAPDTTETRPATDRVREAVFSMIGSGAVGARVLDLYAGSGSFGLEALSRGAATATFVENGRVALKALKHNIGTLGIGGRAVAASVPSYLARDPGTFSLVFIDPPWDLDRERLEQEFLLLDRFLTADATVVTSRRYSDPLPRQPKNWRVATDRRYGDTRILIYDRMAEEE
jgi:16S rRNA (guanine966-N2)-methyltransferase